MNEVENQLYSYLLFTKYFSATKIERFLRIVEEKAFSREIDGRKVLEFLRKAPIWDFAGIRKENFQQFSNDEKSNLKSDSHFPKIIAISASLEHL